MFIASNPGAPAMDVGLFMSFVSSTSSRLEAGSVLTSKTRLPDSASFKAVAHESDVLPTPPLPVKNR